MSSRCVSLVDSAPAARPSTEAVALAAELCGVGALHRSRRAILTPCGLVAIEVVDRFTEIAVELHWRVIADVLAGGTADELAEFRHLELEGYQLAYAVAHLPRPRRAHEDDR